MDEAVAQLDRQLAQELRTRGQRVTSQRLVINRALKRRAGHLTAEQVLGEVGETLPGISLPTVYATLELFEQLGIVRRLNTGGALLFDSRTDEHPHAVCRVCGRVEDLDVRPQTDMVVEHARCAGFSAESTQVLVTGVCDACAR